MANFTQQEKLDVLGVSDEFILQNLKKYEVRNFAHKEMQMLKTWIADNFDLEELEIETVHETEDQRLLIICRNKTIHVKLILKGKGIPYKTIFEMAYALANGVDEWWIAVMITDILHTICCRELSVDELFVYGFLEDYCLKNGNDFVDEGMVMEMAESYSGQKQYRYLSATELEMVLHDLKDKHLIKRKSNKIYPLKQLTLRVGTDTILI